VTAEVDAAEESAEHESAPTVDDDDEASEVETPAHQAELEEMNDGAEEEAETPVSTEAETPVSTEAETPVSAGEEAEAEDTEVVSVEEESNDEQTPEIKHESEPTDDAEVTTPTPTHTELTVEVEDDAKNSNGTKREAGEFAEDMMDVLSPGKKQATEEEPFADESSEADKNTTTTEHENATTEMEVEHEAEKKEPASMETTAPAIVTTVSAEEPYDPETDSVIMAARQRRKDMEVRLQHTKLMMVKMKEGLTTLTHNIDEVKGSFQGLNDRADRVVEESKAHSEGLREMKERMAEINKVRADNDAKFRDQVTALKEKVQGILEKEKENLAKVQSIDEECKEIAATTEAAMAEANAADENAAPISV
jgi:predicted  nucleic acid-binding Zn-ribbon protein